MVLFTPQELEDKYWKRTDSGWKFYDPKSIADAGARAFNDR